MPTYIRPVAQCQQAPSISSLNPPPSCGSTSTMHEHCCFAGTMIEPRACSPSGPPLPPSARASCSTTLPCGSRQASVPTSVRPSGTVIFCKREKRRSEYGHGGRGWGFGANWKCVCLPAGPCSSCSFPHLNPPPQQARHQVQGRVIPHRLERRVLRPALEGKDCWGGGGRR